MRLKLFPAMPTDFFHKNSLVIEIPEDKKSLRDESRKKNKLFRFTTNLSEMDFQNWPWEIGNLKKIGPVPASLTV